MQSETFDLKISIGTNFMKRKKPTTFKQKPVEPKKKVFFLKLEKFQVPLQQQRTTFVTAIHDTCLKHMTKSDVGKTSAVKRKSDNSIFTILKKKVF